ncbi:hypothetical protein Athai_46140 [Actinocatenispora thailandica]|uniref:Helicase XPB/Ssl2 N-terminal domain-containing protein n=1 Tax=Actinocatenispora thailandica TaxID=227318 RepID=A0A7R7DSU8_9ACTN|nr:helicase-associated domain-containing protein [Actinocatenispora thailandica]BCJ37111.1 hypothetical protein Athai_46140 [Actinocatenispora thailandica]
MDELLGWLGRLDETELSRLLHDRPDLLASPVPGTLAELAIRMSHPFSAQTALVGLPAPSVQVAEAVAALEVDASRAALAALVGRDAEDAELANALERLIAQGLVLEIDDRLVLAPGADIWECPLGLGPSVAELLGDRYATEIHKIADALGVGRRSRKADSAAAVVAWLSEADNVRRLVAEAPRPVARMLAELAEYGPTLQAPESVSGWAAQRGLVISQGQGWASELVMPREVAIALRGSQWTAAFDPRCPAPAGAPVAARSVAQASAAAALDALRRMGTVLSACASTPLALRRSGGVGVRELRRLAKTTGETPEQLVLWLQLADSGGLLDEVEDSVRLSPAGEAWRRLAPADAFITLMHAWRTMPDAPGLRLLDGSVTALIWPSDGAVVAPLRLALLRVLATVEAGHRVDPADLTAPVRWRAPLVADAIEHADADLAAAVQVLWQEAETLGVVALGSPSDLVRVSEDPGRLAEVVHEMMPAAVATARFQADLTAVVTGPPSGELAALLDSVADRETTGTAVVWRFSAATVRAALDAGEQAATIVDELTAVSVDQVLPQPLRYLIDDVARQHGRVRVRTVACCLRSDDTALLAEIAATRALRRLGLTVLAPTVVASSVPREETLTALRAAGFAPVVDDDRVDAGAGRSPHRGGPGEPAQVIDLDTHRHPAASSGLEPGTGGRGGAGTDPARLAAELIAAGPDAAPRIGAELATVTDGAPQLSPAERHLLALAVRAGMPVLIEYVNGQGNASSRVIGELELDGNMLSAFCTLRQEERHFLLSRIRSVTPA